MSLCFASTKSSVTLMDSYRHFLISDLFLCLYMQEYIKASKFLWKTSTNFSRQGRLLGVNMNLSIHHAGPPGPKGPVGPPGPSGLNVSLLTVQCWPPVTYWAKHCQMCCNTDVYLLCWLYFLTHLRVNLELLERRAPWGRRESVGREWVHLGIIYDFLFTLHQHP